MERPVKRLKITQSDAHSPRETGSGMAEGLFTSEMGTTSDKEDAIQAVPTRTIALSELRKLYRSKPKRRQILPYGNEGIQLYPRVPDTTVTATVVDVNIDEGTTTISATELPAATDATVLSLSLSSYAGLVTVPGVSTTTADSSTITSDSSYTSSDISASTSSASLNAAASVLSAALTSLTGNSTITSISSSTSGSTVTATATSTFEITYLNGTFIPVHTITDQQTVSKPTSKSAKHSTLSQKTITGLDSSRSHSLPSTASASNSDPGSSDAITFSASTSTPDSSSNPTTIPPFTATSSLPGSGAFSTLPASSSTTSSSNHTNNGPGLTPTQQQVVGGVVGGVAGLAIVLLVLLVFLRWYRRRLKSDGRLPEQIASRGLTSSGTETQMMTHRGHDGGSSSNRSSNVPLAAALALARRWGRPQSGGTFATTATASTVPESERGFQRIAGRKITPVLGAAGGDQFGGSYGAFEKESSGGAAAASRAGGVAGTPTDSKHLERDLSRNSFYRDKGGFYGGDGTRANSVPGRLGHMRGPSETRDFADEPVPGRATGRDLASRSEVDLNANRRAAGAMALPEGYAVMRPSPARTPTTGSVNTNEVRLSMPRGEERGRLGLVDGGAPPTPSLPDGVGGWGQERGRLMVPGVGQRVSPSGSRGSGGSGESRFREGID